MSSEFPKIAVLMAAYNGILWIEEQLASIQAQIGVTVTVYISVDLSTDGTEVWCAKYASAHANVVVLPVAGPFKGASRNFFRLIRDVQLSDYDYVAFCDQDDIWYLDKLQRAVAKLSSSPIDAYSSNVVAVWPDGRRLLVDKAQPQVEWDHLFEAAGPGCTYVLKQSLGCAFRSFVTLEWQRVQEIELHDWFCYAFARSRGFSWFIDPVPGLDYRQHASNQIGVNSGFGSAIARWRKISNGWWFAQIRLTYVLLSVSPPFLNEQGKHVGQLSALKVAFNVLKCRRRFRDRVLLVLICLVKELTDR